MGSDSRVGKEGEGIGCGPESIEVVMRERIREPIERLVGEELDAALGASKSERVGGKRTGDRHGAQERTRTTSLGAPTFAMPRARVIGPDGRRQEWRSRIVPRYERRTERGDEAILGVYLAGTHTRRIRGALAPLRRGGPLSADAVSRLVGRRRADCARWSQRALGEEKIVDLVRDGGIRRCGSASSACGGPCG